MYLSPDQGQQAARLLALLKFGERTAAACAARQAEFADDDRVRRFFRMQARQEAAHAGLFEFAIRVVKPRGARKAVTPPALVEYRRLLDESLDRREHAAVLLGMQVILEAMGELLLERIDYGMEQRQIGFARIRRIVLAQERAHHDFGRKEFATLALDKPEQHASLRQRALQYLHLTDQMIDDTGILFEAFDEDPADYRRALHREVPDWLGVPA